MRFLRKDNVKKTILVISDIHLGAGTYVNGQRNYLEDFHCDQEMVEFLDYYSSESYLERNVELVINGDFFDLLAVPFVEYFDDEFWSEEASLEKLKIIVKAHPEVIEGLKKFVHTKNKKIVFIIGNHDAEFIFDSLQKYFMDIFPEEDREKVKILLNTNEDYIPIEGIHIKHGHEYEVAHNFCHENAIAVNDKGRRYFIPPWGSYYVTRVINKYKEERSYVNAVRPIKQFVINGLIYDTFFMVRFGLANLFYYIMVRFISIFIQKRHVSGIGEELALWKDYEEFARDFFRDNEGAKALLVGHTHNPTFHVYADGNIFINTGTWTKMNYLDVSRSGTHSALTYAQIDVSEKNKKDEWEAVLNRWEGIRTGPYTEFP